MKSKKKSLISDPISSSAADAIQLINDIKKLTVEDVVVSYAYAEAIVETVREPLIILDGDLKIKTANKAFFDAFKVTKKETYNKLIFNLGNGQWDIPELKKLLREILPKNSQFNDFEVGHVFDEIGKRFMVLNARRIVLEGNKTELILLAIEDLTKQRANEEKLHKSEQHYRLLVEQVKDHIIYTLDKDGMITDWNTTAEDVTGYKRDEVLGKFHGLLYTNNDQKSDIPLKEIRAAKRKGMKVSERWHKRKDNTEFWGSGMITAILNEQKELLGFSKVMRDITVEKLKSERKDEFLSIASHELKTPITSIKAYTQLLIRRLTNTEHERFLTNIYHQTNNLTTIINDFLDVGKIEAGKLTFNIKKFDLNELIEKIVEDHQYMTETHQITKVGNVKKKVLGDKDRIGQVLLNLLSNAIKYSPNSTKIIVRVIETNKDVSISVQDFGMGISKNKQKYVFDKYFQVSETSKEGRKGFGLGLYICSEIIHRHKGKMSLVSSKEKGSTFSFTLPY